MTDNYIEAKHEYTGPHDDDGLRLRHVDVWYAHRPSAPGYVTIKHDDEPTEGPQAVVTTAWTLDRAGAERLTIFDREDIAGLRKLLDLLEEDFDRRDWEVLNSTLDVVKESE